MPDWDHQLYLKFSDQRARSAADLIAQIQIENPPRIIDLGCGTGNSTAQLHRRWPQAQLTGLDSSPAMLAQARDDHPDWQWMESAIEDWKPQGTYDLVFSNAALHWVPDHAALFPRLFRAVAPGGALAVQMPNNFFAPAHLGMKRVAADPTWAGALASASEKIFIQPVAFYYHALRTFAGNLNIWETEYLQIMDGHKAVLDWMRSTAMRAYLEGLDNDDQRRCFEEQCLAEFEKSYPADEQGKVLFPYKRMFIVAYR
ncbi:MAG TPA: methyltransferase domain-containing protein [Candidatus Angelobacter sp.]